MWIAPAELARLPMQGAAWNRLKAAADGDLGTAQIADQISTHDTTTLAVALVYARTGTSSYRQKAAEAIASAIGTEQGGRTLALARNLPSYVIAADLIDLRSANAALDARFRAWLRAVVAANAERSRSSVCPRLVPAKTWRKVVPSLATWMEKVLRR